MQLSGVKLETEKVIFQDLLNTTNVINLGKVTQKVITKEIYLIEITIKYHILGNVRLIP